MCWPAKELFWIISGSQYLKRETPPSENKLFWHGTCCLSRRKSKRCQRMQIINKIDHLITKLSELKPALSDDPLSNEKKFNAVLNSNILTGDTLADKAVTAGLSKNTKLENEIPSWVDPDYGYDPQNPRKPNMRELMEAMSGRDLEDLYTETDKNWQEISHQASDILYGVVGTNEDTRDWLSIMASENILTATREQTRIMYGPEVDIKSNIDDHGILTGQEAVIKDNKGNVLSSLSSNITSAEETLLNFGATKESIPANLEDRIDPYFFDNNLLSFLKNFDAKSETIDKITVQSASEVIANKISQEIPLDELAKL
jgi:hypothetical protein